MATQRSAPNAALRGALILAGLTAAAIAIVNLDAITDLTRRDIDLVALVDEAPGVRAGTAVWVEGIAMGRVRNVRISNENDTLMVALDLRIDPEAATVVTRGSDVRASRRRFIADPVIRIFAGDPGEPPIRDGDTIRGLPRALPADLVARLAELRPTFDSIIDAARSVEDRIETRRPQLHALEQQFATIRDATAALDQQVGQGSLPLLLDDRRGLPARLRSLGAHLAELEAAAGTLAARYGPAGDTAVVAQLAALGDRAGEVRARLARLEERLEAGEGFLGRIQEDTALDVAVQGVRLQIDSLMAEAHALALRMLLP